MAPILKVAISALVATPLCQSFAPSTKNAAHRATTTLHASTENHDRQSIQQLCKVLGASSLLAFSLVLSPNVNNAVPLTDTTYIIPSAQTTSILTSDNIDTSDKSTLEILEKETKALEKETATLKKKARVERGRDAYYDYEAKTAAETEARIEAAERKAELEYENDKAELEDLALLELKKKRAAILASTSAEKRALEKEARLLLRKEKEIARKEKMAARAEKIYLAEEVREKEILKAKRDAALREDAKFDKIEKEYEEDAELVKEEEAELSLIKDLIKKK